MHASCMSKQGLLFVHRPSNGVDPLCIYSGSTGLSASYSNSKSSLGLQEGVP